VNLQEYILSGVVENYVLGLSSAEERTEFEKMCAMHPEVLAARNAFEISLENFAVENGVPPPPELRDQIINSVISSSETATPAKVISMNAVENPPKNVAWLKIAAVACLLLLIGSLYYNYNLYNRNQQLQEGFSAVQNQLDSTHEHLARMQKDAGILQQNPNIKMATLHGTSHAPQSFVTVYWDTTSKDVYLLVNNLPAPPSGKQYQLWALLDGTPIDMGMIEMRNDVTVNRKRLLLQMKNAQNVQAFAITLEKKGGSPTPTMHEMYAMGKL
jgi:anti-sigma-K factor RskA